VLSDANQEVSKSIPLQLIQGRIITSARFNLIEWGRFKDLPVPATFIVNRKANNEAGHVEANYPKG